MALKTQAEKDWIKSVKDGNYCPGAGKTPKSGKTTAYSAGTCRGCGRDLRTNLWGYINKHGWGKHQQDVFAEQLVEVQKKEPEGPELGKNPCAECKNKALKNDYLCPTHRAKLTPSLA